MRRGFVIELVVPLFVQSIPKIPRFHRPLSRHIMIEAVADIVIGPDGSNVFVPRGKKL